MQLRYEPNASPPALGERTGEGEENEKDGRGQKPLGDRL